MIKPVRDYELRTFFSYVVNVLERLNIPYMVMGGFIENVRICPRTMFLSAARPVYDLDLRCRENSCAPNRKK